MKVLIPLPDLDFDPTEVAVSWKILFEAGHDVWFATPSGAPGAADPLMLKGEGLDVWGFIPWLRKLRLIGLALRADRNGRRAYQQMSSDPRFLHPLRHAELRAEQFDALLLPGGHAPGMRQYLESRVLHALVADFFEIGKPVAAICHGVLLAARAISPRTGKSVLYGRKTTALTWALERTAWRLTRYFARFWDPHYYRTYRESAGEPSGYWSVQAEVTRALARPEDFVDVPRNAEHHWRKSAGLFRDTDRDSRCAFVVRDDNYFSARWPGDVHTFAQLFAEHLATINSTTQRR